MNPTDFEQRLITNPKPVIVDLWAPWCVPCRAMVPAFKQIQQKYDGQVDVIKINADESPEVLKKLRVMGIPTVIAFANGTEILRRTGLQSAEALDLIFNAALNQRKPDVIPPAPIDRVIRTVVGVALLAGGWFSNQSLVLLGLGVIVLFTAFYDRCPVYRAIIPRLNILFKRS